MIEAISTKNADDWDLVEDSSDLCPGMKIAYRVGEVGGWRWRVCEIMETGWDQSESSNWFVGFVAREDRHPEDPYDGSVFAFYESPDDLEMKVVPERIE